MITQHLFVVLILVGAATSATVLAALLFVPRLTSLWHRTAEDALITFAGDGPSDLADPSFEMRGGMTYGVKLLIGKTYAVSCTKPVAVVGKSDPQVSVTASGPQSFSVVWPVSITEEPPLRSAPPPGLFGAPRPPSDSFTLVVRPSWLDGIFDWSTNACCSVVSNATGWAFSCEENCSCDGCEIGGRYVYEGYSILFDGIRCNCRYEPDPATHFGFTAPPVVFKDGALRPLRVSFRHGDFNVEFSSPGFIYSNH